MKIYWPVALTTKGEKLFTQDGILDFHEAVAQFALWRDGYKYKLKKLWIDVYEDGKKVDTLKPMNGRKGKRK